MKNVWIFCSGSRGDTQPHVAVAIELKKRGYNVRFYTSDDLTYIPEAFGIPAVATHSGADLHRKDSGASKVVEKGNFIAMMRLMAKLADEMAQECARAMTTELETQPLPDLVLASVTAMGIPWFLAAEHNVPYVTLNAQAIVYDRDRMVAGLPTLPFGMHYYLLRHLLLPALYSSHVKFLKHMAPAVLNRVTSRKFVSEVMDPKLPVGVLMSPAVAAALHSGFPANMTFLGTTVVKKDEQLSNLEGFGGSIAPIQDFLLAGPKPIYVGWGSIVSESIQYMVGFCVRSIQASGQRAVVLGGGAKLSQELLEETVDDEKLIAFARENILFVDQAPHEWILPQVALTVHHGGAGTTAAALRAGVPTIITPVFADQYDHSYLVRKLGVGMGFKKPLKRIAPSELGGAIRAVLENHEMKVKAEQLASKLTEEDGAAAAANFMETYWKDTCETGVFRKEWIGATGQ